MKTKRIRATWMVLLGLVLWAGTASAFYNPQVGRWLGRDPIGEPGFELLRGRKSSPARTFLKTRVRPSAAYLYEFVRNNPLLYYDALGLAPERGPNTLACKQAEEQAEAALELAKAEPTQENIEASLFASINAAYWCTPPHPPKPKFPWWRCVMRAIGSIPIIIIPNPCIFGPYELCPDKGPPMA